MKNFSGVAAALIALLVFSGSNDTSAQNFPLKGYVKNSVTGEPIEGANVFIQGLNLGETTDSVGYFIMFLPKGTHSVRFSYVGFEEKKRNVALNRPVTLNMVLEESSQLLQEVSVSGQAQDHNISSAEIGVSKMSMKTIEAMPSFMGEVDVMKSLLMLPGVSTVGEGTTGINVRGGNIDQNLILLDDAPVFNSSHLMGSFLCFQSRYGERCDLLPRSHSGTVRQPGVIGAGHQNPESGNGKAKTSGWRGPYLQPVDAGRTNCR